MASESDSFEVDSSKLAGRELSSAINPPELLAEHERITGGKVRTRFPPEPNGYLHVGHAKSMNMNFKLAFEKLGVPIEKRQTIFRYDDTNPEAESAEYIESLREDVHWLGWRPNPVTFTSDYFPVLFEFAVKMIKKGKAYVCHQTKLEIEECREIAKAKIADPSITKSAYSPWRDRPVEESLREFENMRKGKYAASEATLRLKMDMESPNPNMWDQVAYRIKYVPHPHAGRDWCIYPTYDYTHCIIDSLEHIDYSICTLEFETRRESYYWVLEALDLYRPKVYEMSRLNISFTVLSKRKLLKLVNSGYMRGWDDPRMPTIKGLRRRGYNAEILNSFCMDIGATRNFNIVQYERLAGVARAMLHDGSPRVMAVLRPLKVVLSGRPSNLDVVSVPDFPFDPSRGSHSVPFTDIIYIDRSDFRVEDDDDYFGLAPGKAVGLKYAVVVRCDSFDISESGEPTVLYCAVLGEGEVKPKGTVQWVPDGVQGCLDVEVRTYGNLFTVDEPSDSTWEEQLNPESEIVLSGKVDSSIIKWPTAPEASFQFERVGFFVVDKDSTPVKLIFNLTVALKDGGKPKSVTDGNSTLKSRKEEQAKQMAEKLARKNVAPEDMFKSSTELYSQFDENGIPTHDAAGEKLSKSAMKKMQKEWEKQKRLFESSK